VDVDMSEIKKSVALVDLPTFPKGIVSLSLPRVASFLRKDFDVRIIDLNLIERVSAMHSFQDIEAIGLKVSAQNYKIAISVTKELKLQNPKRLIFWGGEFPTLMPEKCLEYVDTIVVGSFESQASQFIEDLKNGHLEAKYHQTTAPPPTPPVPALDLVDKSCYYSFMGQPLETSLGCKFKCTFCMVHTMQKHIDLNPTERLQEDLTTHPRRFANIIDYNLGNSKSHLFTVAAELARSPTWGWMGEMCIDELDDEEVLLALQKSRCRIIYCGLESIQNKALKTINKTQNKVSEYTRIIKKAQSYGIQVASGFIVGLEGTTLETFRETLAFYETVGIIYIKITFLTFNPGTKVNTSMSKMGRYVSEEIEHFDGNHLTFIASDVQPSIVYEGTQKMIRDFYSLRSALKRSQHLRYRPLQRLEFLLFSYCYGDVYRQWLQWGLLEPEANRFVELLERPMRKTFRVRSCEALLEGVRWLRFRLTARITP
jgi:radical SAM superfamily enzyme YgiQ (UPF0313 family)